MSQRAADVPERSYLHVGPWFVVLLLGAFSLAYIVAMKFAIQLSLAEALFSTLANILPLALLGLGTRHLLRHYLSGSSAIMQFISHVVLAIMFALLWYWALMVLLGLQAGHSWTSFQVRPIFKNPAISWMLLQGLTFYPLVVALTLLEARSDVHSPAGNSSSPPDIFRYFIKEADAIRPVDAREIVSIRGAGDYAEVTTEKGRHLARRTLAEFEILLKAEKFIRVHRASIVNLERIAHAESAGDGRLLLHMENGEMIQTSRAGAKLLRPHVI